MDDYLDGCKAIIQEHGWLVQYVGATQEQRADDPEFVDFAYTVGLSAKGLPEIVTVGLGRETMHHLLNDAAAASMLAPYEVGILYDGILVGCSIRFIEASEEHLGVARALYGERLVGALQMLWPDTDGQFPDEAGYDANLPQPMFVP